MRCASRRVRLVRPEKPTRSGWTAMKLVSHYHAQAEGCRNFAQRAKSESLRKRYTALAAGYLALAAERERFLKATQAGGIPSMALGTATGPEKKKHPPSGAR